MWSVVFDRVLFIEIGTREWLWWSIFFSQNFQWGKITRLFHSWNETFCRTSNMPWILSLWRVRKSTRNTWGNERRRRRPEIRAGGSSRQARFYHLYIKEIIFRKKIHWNLCSVALLLHPNGTSSKFWLLLASKPSVSQAPASFYVAFILSQFGL